MAAWEDFEIKCTEYLNRKFGDYAEFIHQGGSDSTVPDILVRTASGRSFYIDAKHCPAQCGQFVLHPNSSTRTFEYSRKNAATVNQYAQGIIEHMNESFDEYKGAGTSGKSIIMGNGSAVFANWIVLTYRNKGVRFFITNDYKIFPIDAFSEHFAVEAKYRVKRSGSREVGKKIMSSVMAHIQNGDYGVTGMESQGGKLFVTADRDIHNIRFNLDDAEYMFSDRSGKYEVRRLSNVCNANVIFSITLKNNRTGLTDGVFIACLQ